MTPLEWLVVAFAVAPLVAAVAIEVRSRREHRRFQAALEEERRETAIRYAGDDEITERRQSFSSWPWANRSRR